MVDSRHFAHTASRRRHQRHPDTSFYSVGNEQDKVHVSENKREEKKESSVHLHLKHTLSFREKLQFVLIRTFGNFLLLISLYGVASTFGPVLSYEVQFRVAQARGVRYVVADPTPTPLAVNPTPSIIQLSPTPTPEVINPGFADAIAGAKEQVIVPPDSKFSIVIPKLGAASRVIPNVDPTNESEFVQQLGKGVAHAKGTVFPGMQGNVYLFAHSTDSFWNVGRYNAVFYLIKDLQIGDEIIIYFEGRRYNYYVDKSEIKDAQDVEYLVKSQQLGDEALILQTCWPPGTTWKRLYVIARPA